MVGNSTIVRSPHIYFKVTEVKKVVSEDIDQFPEIFSKTVRPINFILGTHHLLVRHRIIFLGSYL